MVVQSSVCNGSFTIDDRSFFHNFLEIVTLHSFSDGLEYPRHPSHFRSELNASSILNGLQNADLNNIIRENSHSNWIMLLQVHCLSKEIKNQMLWLQNALFT